MPRRPMREYIHASEEEVALGYFVRGMDNVYSDIMTIVVNNVVASTAFSFVASAMRYMGYTASASVVDTAERIAIPLLISFDVSNSAFSSKYTEEMKGELHSKGLTPVPRAFWKRYRDMDLYFNGEPLRMLDGRTVFPRLQSAETSGDKAMELLRRYCDKYYNTESLVPPPIDSELMPKCEFMGERRVVNAGEICYLLDRYVKKYPTGLRPEGNTCAITGMLLTGHERRVMLVTEDTINGSGDFQFASEHAYVNMRLGKAPKNIDGVLVASQRAPLRF